MKVDKPRQPLHPDGLFGGELLHRILKKSQVHQSTAKILGEYHLTSAVLSIPGERLANASGVLNI